MPVPVMACSQCFSWRRHLEARGLLVLSAESSSARGVGGGIVPSAPSVPSEIGGTVSTETLGNIAVTIRSIVLNSRSAL